MLPVFCFFFNPASISYQIHRTQTSHDSPRDSHKDTQYLGGKKKRNKQRIR